MLKAKKLISVITACTIAASVVSAGAGYIPAAHAAAAVDVPNVSSPAGRYEQSVSVMLSDGTTGADIYYTLDGTMPDQSSLKFNGTPIVLTETTNLSVIALKDGVWSKGATYGYIVKTAEQPLLKFAAMSDIHIGPGTPEQDAVTRARYASNFDVLSSIFPNPDAILIAGDIINDNGNGLGPHHQFARSVFEEQLTRKNWTNVPVQIAIGNHDASVAEVKQYYPSGWFTDQTNGYYEKTIKDYSFFFLNGNNYNGDTAQRNWLKGRLAALTADPATMNKPIFITLHQPVSGTVMDGQQTTNANLYTDLKDYPQVIVLSGHSHLDINDDRSIYQKDFTAVNLGSMSYIEVDHGYSAVTDEGLMDNRFEMPEQQSQLIEVYPDRVEIERVEYNGDPWSIYVGGVWQGAGPQTSFNSAGAIAGKKWVIKLQGATKDEIKSNFTYTSANRNKTAPQFPASPELAVTPGANNVPVLSFKQAKDDQSMHHYEIKLYDQRTAQVAKTYNVLSDFYFSPIPNRMNIPMTGLSPATSYIVSITAVDAYGNKSAPLQTSYRADGTAPVLTPIDPSTMWNQLVTDMNFNGNLNENASGSTGLATSAGSVTFVPGKSGQAVSIPSGNANYVDLGDRSDLKFGTGDFTVSFWHTGNMAGDQTIISNKNWNSGKNPGWYIGPAVANVVTLNIADGTNRVDYSTPNVGTDWHLVTVTVNRATKLATTYIDGVMQASKDLTTLGAATLDTPYHIIIGADGNKQNGGATVTMDDLKIWKRALTATEAKALSDSYKATTLYTFAQLTAKIQEADQFAGYVAGTTGLSLPAQAQNDLNTKLAAAKALTAGDDAAAIDQSYMDLMWTLQGAKTAIVYRFIPKTAFTIDSVSSTDLDGDTADHILDGQEATIWHSKYETPAAPFPHWVIIDMKDTYKLEGIQRKSRLSQTAMEFPKTFALYASDKLADLNDPDYLANPANKASGTFGNTWTGTVYKDFVALDKPVQGRYAKFLVTGTYNADVSKTFTSMSEVDFTGTKIANGDASLTDLRINGAKVAGFAPDTMNYSVNVPNDVASANVAYTTASPDAIVVVDGGAKLAEGINTVSVTVTAQNGTSKIYTISVNRGAAQPDVLNLQLAQFYASHGNAYNAVYYYGLAIANGNTGLESEMNDAAGRLQQLAIDEMEAGNFSQAYSDYQLLSATPAVPADVLNDAKNSMNADQNVGLVWYYYEQHNLYNAVYYLSQAKASGNASTGIVALTSYVSTKLQEQAESEMRQGQFNPAYADYQLLQSSPGVPASIAQDAASSLTSSASMGQAWFYLSASNWHNAVYHLGIEMQTNAGTGVSALMSYAAQKLQQQAQSVTASQGSFALSYADYVLLASTAGVPTILAQDAAKTIDVSDTDYGDALWYLGQRNYDNAKHYFELVAAKGNTSTGVNALLTYVESRIGSE